MFTYSAMSLTGKSLYNSFKTNLYVEDKTGVQATNCSFYKRIREIPRELEGE